MQIHPTAIVSPECELGADVEIGPYCVIGGPSRIDAGCKLGPHVVVHAYSTIGRGTEIHAGAVIGDLPQDVSFRGGHSEVVIGANCIIREGVTIHRGTKEGTRTVIGDGCFLMANSHVGHNVVLGQGVILANGALLAGYVEVDDRAFISGNAVVHQFCKVGRLAMVSGISGISKDLPPYCIAFERNRVAGLNVVGLRRAGFSTEQRQQIKQAFDVLFRSGLNQSQAYDELKRLFPEGPASEFWRFIERSTRGLCAFRREAEVDY